MQPSPSDRRVGIRIVTFEACSGFTRVTARRIARPPKAAFVTRLQPRHCTTELLVSYRTYRQLSGWNPPPLVIRAVRAHCQNQTFKSYGPQSAGRLRKKASAILTKKITIPTAKP